jgi:hypothetical protein
LFVSCIIARVELMVNVVLEYYKYFSMNHDCEASL